MLSLGTLKEHTHNGRNRMAVTMRDLMRQAEWQGHKLGAETTARVAGVRRAVRKCTACGRALVLDPAAGWHGAAYNATCTGNRGGKPTLWFR